MFLPETRRGGNISVQLPSNAQGPDTVLLPAVTPLYLRSPELAQVLAESLRLEPMAPRLLTASPWKPASVSASVSLSTLGCTYKCERAECVSV